MSERLVDIIVPSCGQPALLEACFASIAASEPNGRVRVIWVENGVKGNGRSYMGDALARSYIEILHIAIPEMLGFVKATNLGLAAATAPNVLLLNSDTELPLGWLDAMLDVLEREPKVGLVGPWSSCEGQWQGRDVKLEPGYSVLGPDAMLAFFCTLIRRSVVADVGYLSEEWGPGWGDDDDYCARAQMAGWQMALCTSVLVQHVGSATINAVYSPAEWAEIRGRNLARLRTKTWYKRMEGTA